MKRRNFIAFIGAVCAFPTALFAKAKPIHRFHKGSLGGTFRPEELNLLTETKLNQCLTLWSSHRTKPPTVVLLSVANMRNLLQEFRRYNYNPRPVEDFSTLTQADWRFGGRLVRLQTTVDFEADHVIVIGRLEQDEDAMSIFLKKSDRSRRMILTGTTEPAFEMIA